MSSSGCTVNNGIYSIIISVFFCQRIKYQVIADVDTKFTIFSINNQSLVIPSEKIFFFNGCQKNFIIITVQVVIILTNNKSSIVEFFLFFADIIEYYQV